MLVSSGGVGQLSKSRTDPAWFFVQRKIELSKALSVNVQKLKLDKLSCWKKTHMPGNSLWPFKRMVKWPFEMVKWPPIGGWKGHIESPGDGNHEISSHWWGLEIQKTLRFLGLKKLFILSWPLSSKSPRNPTKSWWVINSPMGPIEFVKNHQPGDSKWPFDHLVWRSLSHLKGSLNHPKKVTLNHQEL